MPPLPKMISDNGQTTDSKPPNDPLRALEWLLGKLCPVPEEWLRGHARGSGGAYSNKGALQPLRCESWQNLVGAWRGALEWTDGLDNALAVMLASVASVRTVGDQLWIKVIGPAACGKSTLCEAMSVAKDYVVAKSTIRGFHSGFREDGSGNPDEDNSLLAMLYDKTLITKDGDTLLSSPELPRILSEARDLYDGTARTHYRNKASKDYDRVRMTWILCGTSSLRLIDESELGERFLDTVIMESIDDELEDRILRSVIERAERSMAAETDGEAESYYEPEIALAYRLTGGYVEWLRGNAAVLGEIVISERAKRQCLKLAKFTACMRARPSKKQEESAERELASRLASQLVRLSKCLALVLNKESVDFEVMRRVTGVAMDTSRGQTLDLLRLLHERDRGVPYLVSNTGRTEDKTRMMLRFLQQIGVAQPFQAEGQRGTRWQLAHKIHDLYREVGDSHA